ncbi:MAG: peroxiredoxin [Patescibacteria group bacterium]
MIQLGKPAPSFKDAMAYKKGEDGFIKVSLDDYYGKWLILFFYPRDFTFVCPTEIKGFAAKEVEFDQMNCKILAASTDSEWSHKNWLEKDLPEVNFPIVADTTHKIAEAYQILNEDDGSAERGLFIIDPSGNIKYALVSSGSVGRSVDETLRVLKALQSGDLCPVGWQPGQDTLGKA